MAGAPPCQRAWSRGLRSTAVTAHPCRSSSAVQPPGDAPKSTHRKPSQGHGADEVDEDDENEDEDEEEAEEAEEAEEVEGEDDDEEEGKGEGVGKPLVSSSPPCGGSKPARSSASASFR